MCSLSDEFLASKRPRSPKNAGKLAFSVVEVSRETKLVTAVQAWLGAIATLLTTIAGVYLNYKSRRERIAEVGSTFASTVDALSTDNDVKRMAAAVLLRRFFDERSELAVRGVGAPYPQGSDRGHRWHASGASSSPLTKGSRRQPAIRG
jgi:hypothetical protein